MTDILQSTLTQVGVWDGSVPPGGYVCPWCGDPWESEPSCEHAKVVQRHDDLTAAEVLRNAANGLWPHSAPESTITMAQLRAALRRLADEVERGEA